MDRLWDWYRKGLKAEDIDGFITGLRKANYRELKSKAVQQKAGIQIRLNQPKEDLLNKENRLNEGDVAASIYCLLMAAHNPCLTDKVAVALLEMNKYLDHYYPDNKEVEPYKLAIPAALKALDLNIKQNIEDVVLKKEIKNLIKNTEFACKKNDILNGTSQFSDYSNLVPTYKTILTMSFTSSQSEKTHQPTRNSRGQIEI